MAPAGLTTEPDGPGGAEKSSGLLGAVLRAAGSPEPILLEASDAWLTTNLTHSRMVLTSPDDFVTPFSVRRGRIRRRDRSSASRAAAKDTPPLSAEAVRLGRARFAAELQESADALAPGVATELDTLVFLRAPVARSTAAALLPGVGSDAQARVGDHVLAWIDALAPIISAPRPPGPWSGVRRAEKHALRTLLRQLDELGAEDPPALATALAAGVQVPIAAGAWCLTQLAADPRLPDSLRETPELVLPFVWEVLRLYPPTWLLPRVTTRPIEIGSTSLPAYTPVLVSPMLLGRLTALVPGPDHGYEGLEILEPRRWTGESRPGGWLPFGAGPHACPGRNLGLAQLTELVDWASGCGLSSAEPPVANTSRGLSPEPSWIRLTPGLTSA